MWREGLGCYKILTEDKKGYRNHPAVKEFENALLALWIRLKITREEMLKRGYNPKELPDMPSFELLGNKVRNDWQTLDEQIEVLKLKGCVCKV